MKSEITGSSSVELGVVNFYLEICDLAFTYISLNTLCFVGILVHQ